MTNPLHKASENDRRLRDELLRLFPQLAEDEKALLDTLDGESDLDAQVRAVVLSILTDEGLVMGLEATIDMLGKRRLRLEERALTKRALVLAAIQNAGRKRFEFPEATVYTAKGKDKVIITDEDALAAQYWKPQPAKVDKALIGDDLRAGVEVDGATLSNGADVLHIKKG